MEVQLPKRKEERGRMEERGRIMLVSGVKRGFLHRGKDPTAQNPQEREDEKADNDEGVHHTSLPVGR